MSKTLAIIVSNDDFLKLNQSDLNYLISETTSLNYQVKKLSVVPHDRNLLAFEIEHLLKQNDFLILINGSNLNLVYSSVAEVFKSGLVRGKNRSEAEIPKYSKSLTYNDLPETVVYLNRLFIVGDSNLKVVYDMILKTHLRQFNKEKSFIKKFVLNCSDVFCADDWCNDRVQLTARRDGKMLIVEAQSANLDCLLEYESYLKGKFSHVWQRRSYSTENVYNNFCFPHIMKAINCIEKCLEKYEPKNVFVSFNGGKDCTVLLHLVLTVLKEKYPDYSTPVICMYVQSMKPFAQVNDFIDKAKQLYNLEIHTITRGVKEGLCEFLGEKPNMTACFMGTRRSDPYSENLRSFQMTDSNWPQVMRISPLLDWHYSEIWDYLLYYQLPYCSLYDEGYTSLGSVHNTMKNADLLYGTRKNNETYLPAYKLLDGSKERSGRM